MLRPLLRVNYIAHEWSHALAGAKFGQRSKSWCRTISRRLGGAVKCIAMTSYNWPLWSRALFIGAARHLQTLVCVRPPILGGDKASKSMSCPKCQSQISTLDCETTVGLQSLFSRRLGKMLWVSDPCLPAFDSTSVVWQDKIKKVNSRILTSLNKAQELNPTYTGSMDNSTGGREATFLFHEGCVTWVMWSSVAYLIAGFGDGSINFNCNRFG